VGRAPITTTLGDYGHLLPEVSRVAGTVVRPGGLRRGGRPHLRGQPSCFRRG